MSKQLIKPDLDTEGSIRNCKIYARSVFHIASTGKYPTAFSNWEAAKYKHSPKEKLPKDVAILCWFSGYGGAGHVVVSVPGKGFYSSPYSRKKAAKYQQGTNTRAVLPSIAEIERIYGVKYVGWSEDIEDKRVAKITDSSTIDPVMEILTSAPVFNPAYYLKVNPDVAKAGIKPKAHWLKNGIKEGRPSAPNFHVKEYLANYSDLKKAYGTNYKKAALHYFNHGINEEREGRRTVPGITLDKFKTLAKAAIDRIKS